MPDVVVSIVSFNTRDRLEACLSAVTASASVAADVWVVDNASSDGSPELVESMFPSVGLVRSPRNIGFAAANNLVIRQTSLRYVLLLNPDTEVPPDALRRMVDFMNVHPSAGICGPRLINADRSFQSCGLAFPTLWSEIRQSRSVARLMRRWIEPARDAVTSNLPVETDWVSGACLLIRRETIDRIGLMDEQFFIYAEELDWCYRARRAGWKTYALPEIPVVHHEAESMNQVRATALMHLVETRLRFYRKHHGWPYAAMVSLVYVAGCFRRMPEDGQKAWTKLRGVQWWWRTCLRELTARRSPNQSATSPLATPDHD